MDEEIKTLETQLESYYSAVEESKSFDPELANDFLSAFEEYEITIDGYMKPEQYVDFMVLYFVTDNWHNPAKFLWKRIPAAMKKEKDLKAVWELGKLLYQSKYLAAAKEISTFNLGKLAHFLIEGYRFHMHKLIEKAYINIDDKTYQALMGFKTSKEQKEYQTHFDEELRQKGKNKIFNYFIATDKDGESVEINGEHLKTLKLIAQFIEKENVTQIEREA